MQLKGCFTAIVTPFQGTGINNPVDWDAYEKLLEFQFDQGVDGIVASGTTGESPVLNHKEHNKVIRETVENFNGITIAGTGSNSTFEAVEMTKAAEDVGANASLQVSPYYNKPNQDGLFRHFGAVAESTGLPIILYNIPGRSGINIEASTMKRLMEEYSNIIGVKEATGNEESWRKIREACGPDFIILSGNDGDSYKMMKDHDARGVVSVASNLIPSRMKDFIHMGLEGDFAGMEKENIALKSLFDVLFIDTNPIPVKEAMNMAGMKAGGFRYPLCESSESNRSEIRKILQAMNII